MARSSRTFVLSSLKRTMAIGESAVSEALDVSLFQSFTAYLNCDKYVDPNRAYLLIEHSTDGTNWCEAARLNINMIVNPAPVEYSCQLAHSPIMRFARVKVISTGIEFNILAARAEAKD